jgi:hypothetical protein
MICLTSAGPHEKECCRRSPLGSVHIIYGCVAQLSCSPLAVLECPARTAHPATSRNTRRRITGHGGVVIVAHHRIIGRLQPRGVQRRLSRRERTDATKRTSVGRLVAVDVGTSQDGPALAHRVIARLSPPLQTHSVGRGKRDLHFGVTLQLGQFGTTSHRSTALNSPVITTRPANIYDLMIGSWHETQMTGLGSHRPLFISRHDTATLRWQYRSDFLVGKWSGFLSFAIFQSPTQTVRYHLLLLIASCTSTPVSLSVLVHARVH